MCQAYVRVLSLRSVVVPSILTVLLLYDAHPVRPSPALFPLQELGLLRDCWKQVSEGRGRVVLVSGDAGIGKSHLVQALLSHVEQEPHAHLEFRCSAYYANSPLYPVVALLPAVLGWSR